MRLTLYSIVDRDTGKRLMDSMYNDGFCWECRRSNNYGRKSKYLGDPRFTEKGAFFRCISTIKRKLDELCSSVTIENKMCPCGKRSYRAGIFHGYDKDKLNRYYVEVLVATSERPPDILTAKQVLGLEAK